MDKSQEVSGGEGVWHQGYDTSGLIPIDPRPYPHSTKRVHFVNLCNLFEYLGLKVITGSVKQPWH